MLSPREREVLRLLADGLVISQISGGLHISESTTKTHVANIYDKLGAGTRAQAVLAGRRLGLIGDDDGGALVPATPQPKPPTLPPRGGALAPPLPPPVDSEDDWPHGGASGGARPRPTGTRLSPNAPLSNVKPSPEYHKAFHAEKAWNKPGAANSRAGAVAHRLRDQYQANHADGYIDVRVEADGVHLILRPGTPAPESMVGDVPIHTEHVDRTSLATLYAGQAKFRADILDRTAPDHNEFLRLGGGFYGVGPATGTVRSSSLDITPRGSPP